ncbi:MAG: hypothetical protein GEU94_20295 [Micromonosporaceae bacterium]|nr:hypothetical protein [Micromonosporaceae bacterium]
MVGTARLSAGVAWAATDALAAAVLAPAQTQVSPLEIYVDGAGVRGEDAAEHLRQEMLRSADLSNEVSGHPWAVHLIGRSRGWLGSARWGRAGLVARRR